MSAPIRENFLFVSKARPIILRVHVDVACFVTSQNGGRCPVEAALWRLTGEHWELNELSVKTPDGDWLLLPLWVSVRAAEWARWNAKKEAVRNTSSTHYTPHNWTPQVTEPYRFDLEIARYAWFLPDKPKRVMPHRVSAKPPLELVADMPQTPTEWIRFRAYRERLANDVTFAEMEEERIEGWRACGRDAPPYWKNWG